MAFFVAVYAASAVAFLVPPSLVTFPVLVAAVAAAGLIATAATGGRVALAALWNRLTPRLIPIRWLALLALPPLGILATLTVLRLAVSPAFTPGFLLLGIPIGLVAGFLEEIGWTGFAFPRMEARLGAGVAAPMLGFIWGVWHMPVVDTLGAASPHGAASPAFFAAFVALVAAVRCLICWVYVNTRSLLLAQLIHASSTGSLVLLSAQHVTAWQEAAWYAAYAALLWAVLAVAVGLIRQRRRIGVDSAHAAIPGEVEGRGHRGQL